MDEFACILYTPAHTELNKTCFEEGLREFSTRGNRHPRFCRTTNCFWDDLFSSTAAGRAPWGRVSPHSCTLKSNSDVKFYIVCMLAQLTTV